MGIAYNTSVIRDGLVFHYDMSNVQKSWKGKPTTNLLPQPLFFESGYTKESWTTGTVEDNSEIAPDGTLTATKIIRVSGYFYKRNVSSPTFTISPGQTVTFSSWVKKLDSTDQTGRGLYIWCYNGAGSGNRASASQEIFSDKWVRQSVTYTALTGETDFSFGFSGAASSHLQGSIAIWRPQVEISNFATPFVNGTRSNTEALIDLTRSETINTGNLSYNSDGTFGFNGSSNYMDLGADVTISPANQGWTAEYWFNTNSASTLQHFNSAEADNFNANWLALLNSKLAVWNVSPGYWKYGDTVIQSNTWYQGVFVCYPGGTTMRFYINGEAEGGDHVSNSWVAAYSALTTRYVGRYEYNGSYSRYWNGKISSTKMYNRALSANEVKRNFEATRGRYGL